MTNTTNTTDTTDAPLPIDYDPPADVDGEAAEREYEDRQAVAAAIAERSDELATQEAQSEQTESLTPGDLAV